MIQDTSQIFAVFVQLGDKFPKHLIRSLERHVSIFPEVPCVLIVNAIHDVRIPKEVRIEMYSPTASLDELFQEAGKKLDHKFRSGFWRYTFERLFALQTFHEKYPEAKLLHIESDVLILPRFPWNKFAEYNFVTWLQVNETHDVAALVHLPNLSATKSLCNFLQEELERNPDTTDMYALLSYTKEQSRGHRYLPSLSEWNTRTTDFEIINQNMDSAAYFGGYFDPLAIGIWYFGQDPKNNYGKSIRYKAQSHHYLDATKVRLEYKEGQLLDQFQNEWFSIHLHSKNMNLFGQNWEKWLIKYLQEAVTESNISIYSFAAFCGAIKDRPIRQHIWHYLAKKPILQKIFKNSSLKTLVTAMRKLLGIGTN